MEVLVELLNPERAFRATATDLLVNSKWLASERDKVKLAMSDTKRKLSDGPNEITLEGNKRLFFVFKFCFSFEVFVLSHFHLGHPAHHFVS
jgi:hypothetical protein